MASGSSKLLALLDRPWIVEGTSPMEVFFLKFLKLIFFFINERPCRPIGLGLTFSSRKFSCRHASIEL